jgi:hypothetical protein
MNLKIIFIYNGLNDANSLGFGAHFLTGARLRLGLGFNRGRDGVRAGEYGVALQSRMDLRPKPRAGLKNF